ncbi:MAG: glycosyltransferase [Clostridia bacterium]|nr:glycosyltransferase [Clostridia bacterium]
MFSNVFSRVQEYLQFHGAAYTARRLGQKAAQQLLGIYDRRRKREMASAEELQSQRNSQPDAGLISVVVPVWNTDPGMLTDLLDSLEAQTYLNFEAVLYDGASTRTETLEILKARGEKDPRFRVIRGEENRGISQNTNEAIRLARGGYVALCDHDDLLSPDALWRVADCIVKKQPDMVYSDEDRITEGGKKHMDPHYKPDYCPDNLVSDNYICHLAVIRKDLLEAAGGLRSGYDGSQDHDLFLRITEKTGRIEHIPRTLYSWREVFSSKSHMQFLTCLENGCRAAVEHEAKMGRKAEAVPVNKEIRLWYEIPEDAAVEALVHGDSEDECRECLGELAFRTDWPKLTGSILVAPEEERISLINEAARTSKADYLLVLDAGVTEMNRYFIREMLMYAQRDDVAGVTGVLTDRKKRITHGGFALGVDHTAQCINEGLYVSAGGWHDMMNKVHNVSAVSLCCLMVKRSCWLDLDEGYRGGLATADLGLRQRAAGKWFVFTPHAQAQLAPCPLLLSGKDRNAADVACFEKAWGKDVTDPCYSKRFGTKKANYQF